MKKAVFLFLLVAVLLIEFTSATCGPRRFDWGPATTVENTDVTIAFMVEGDTCQGKVVSFSVKEYDKGQVDDTPTNQPASVTITSNSPNPGAWVYAGGTWRAQYMEDTDHPGETNPPEYYLTAILDGQTYTTKEDRTYVFSNQYMNVTKYVASQCSDSDGGKNYYVNGLTSGFNTPTELGNFSDVCYEVIFGNLTQNCSGSQCYLAEMYCDGSYVRKELGISCPYGCSNGACLGNLSNQSNQPNNTDQCDNFVEGEILVGFNKNATRAQATSLVNASNLTFRDVYANNSWNNSLLKVLKVFVPEGDEDYWIESLSNNSIVKYAELDCILEATNAKQQASAKLNETKTNLERIKNQIRTYPQQYQQTISEAIALTTIENKYFALNRSFASANSDEAYNNITRELQNLNVPSQITSSNSARSIVFLPQRENMDIDLLARITGENYSSEKESQYKEAIVAWNLDNLDTKIDFTEISMLRNKTQSKVVIFYKINIAERGKILDNYYLIIPKMEGLKFSGNYNPQPVDDLNYITLTGSKVIEFSSTETISFAELPLFITPNIGELGVSIGGGEGKDKISKWWIFLLIVLFLIIGFFVIYAILHKWYRNEYERYLFTTRTNLFNILHYINNSRGNNMAEGNIAGNLKKSGWSGEQITYAMKTYKGKRTGMMNLFGLFKSNKPGNVAPSPQRVLPSRDRQFTQKNP